MQREELLERLRALKTLLSETGVTHVSLFGSRARNDHRDDSDLDLLIEVDPDRKFSLVELARAQAGVSREIGIPASLALKRSLDPRFAAEIAGDMIDVF
jgi:uncharacterized protein